MFFGVHRQSNRVAEKLNQELGFRNWESRELAGSRVLTCSYCAFDPVLPIMCMLCAETGVGSRDRVRTEGQLRSITVDGDRIAIL